MLSEYYSSTIGIPASSLIVDGRMWELPHIRRLLRQGGGLRDWSSSDKDLTEGSGWIDKEIWALMRDSEVRLRDLRTTERR